MASVQLNVKDLQKLRVAAAIAGTWMTPGQFPPTTFAGVSVPEKDFETAEIVKLLKEGLQATE